MADILIKGLEMPTGDDDVKLIINSDGRVHRIIGWAVSEKMNAKAIELPPHGRLIEENKAYDSIMEQTANHYIDMDGVDLGLQNTPTILEASK